MAEARAAASRTLLDERMYRDGHGSVAFGIHRVEVDIRPIGNAVNANARSACISALTL